MNEIGLIFKTKRQELGLTIEDVNRQIYVPIAYIKAVEEGDMSKFPAEVYYTGTVRRYGILLGLNTDEIISQYANSKIKAQAVALKIEKDGKEFPYIYLAAGVALLVGIGILFFGGTKKPQPENAKPVVVVAASEATTQQVVLHQQVVEEKIHPLMLVITGTTGSWVRLHADDKKVFEGVVVAGVSQKFGAENKFSLKIGYVPGITATLNKKPIDISAGARQDINELTLTKENIK
jgi:cytoskeleton protein RodZ